MTEISLGGLMAALDTLAAVVLRGDRDAYLLASGEARRQKASDEQIRDAYHRGVFRRGASGLDLPGFTWNGDPQ